MKYLDEYRDSAFAVATESFFEKPEQMLEEMRGSNLLPAPRRIHVTTVADDLYVASGIDVLMGEPIGRSVSSPKFKSSICDPGFN